MKTLNDKIITHYDTCETCGAVDEHLSMTLINDEVFGEIICNQCLFNR